MSEVCITSTQILKKSYDSKDTILATCPRYDNQSSGSDLKSDDVGSNICSQSLNKNNIPSENSDQQKNDQTQNAKYHEVCDANISVCHENVAENFPDLASLKNRDISKISSETFSQVVTENIDKENLVCHNEMELPVNSASQDQNKNEIMAYVSYRTEVSGEEKFNQAAKSDVGKSEYEELHLVSEESIALSENKIDISSVSPEMMEIILKKRTELEKNFTKDCQVFVSVCEFLLSKDPGLTEQLQTCMQKCLEDISENFAEAFQNFVQTTIDRNEAKH